MLVKICKLISVGQIGPANKLAGCPASLLVSSGTKICLKQVSESLGKQLWGNLLF